MINLEVRHAPAHHYVCHSMCLREHVLDLLTASHIPVRYIMSDHIRFPLRPLISLTLGDLTLTDILHDLE